MTFEIYLSGDEGQHWEPMGRERPDYMGAYRDAQEQSRRAGVLTRIRNLSSERWLVAFREGQLYVVPGTENQLPRNPTLETLGGKGNKVPRSPTR